MGRQTKWTEEDLLVALDVYLTLWRQQGIKLSEKILDNSPYFQNAAELIDHLWIHQGKSKANRKSFKSYIMGFANYDESYPTGGTSIGKKEHRLIWKRYVDNEETLKREMESIRQKAALLRISSQSEPEEAEFEGGALEGKYQHHLRLERQRSQKLVSDKKEQFQKAHSRLFCELCGFDFAKVYGEQGEGFIECHHKKPISQLDGTEVTQLDDLILLCANCHRMAHRNGLLSVEALQTILKWRFG